MIDLKERDRKLKIRLDAIKGCGKNTCRICDDHADFALSLLKEPVDLEKRVAELEDLLRKVLNSDMAQMAEDEGRVCVLLGEIRVKVT